VLCIADSTEKLQSVSASSSVHSSRIRGFRLIVGIVNLDVIRAVVVFIQELINRLVAKCLSSNFCSVKI